ncbi:porin family protein [Halomonas sp. McH1-25]|uniref:outer membrane beta-barrel protein n=1 Tax=unclassified Halomonas TaxID=2609666 RepID=UPI001EF4485E|nr:MULTISPECIES: outer membrane beta-barrel protein [unclassified Halomonas]MCG7600895.1 porin family protein [Halomonas sp. McH1-25]MCP1341483.1 porin family protein [Halomonas sp. FL8]MCP1360074.1 porin family protein [Halomonas sp. BBD45]MCP1364234.1 porin family protein [Halomonas sp. BBD48]
MNSPLVFGSFVICLGLLAVPVHAYHDSHSEQYVAADAFLWEYDPEGAPAVNDLGVRLRAGELFNEFLGVEGQLATGGTDKEKRTSGDLDFLAGAYGKFILPIDRALHLYALLGFSVLGGDFSPGDDNVADLSGGFGTEMSIAPNLVINADYMRYTDTSDAIFDAISVGVVYHFH